MILRMERLNRAGTYLWGSGVGLMWDWQRVKINKPYDQENKTQHSKIPHEHHCEYNHSHRFHMKCLKCDYTHSQETNTTEGENWLKGLSHFYLLFWRISLSIYPDGIFSHSIGDINWRLKGNGGSSALWSSQISLKEYICPVGGLIRWRSKIISIS